MTPTKDGTVKLIHTADWHLDERQYNKTWRGEDFFNAAMFICREAVKLGAKYILNSGDTLNTKRPGSGVPPWIQRINDYLAENGVMMLNISGNHDKTSPSWMDLPREAMGQAGKTTPGIFNLDDRTIDIAPGLTVMGLPFQSTDKLRARLSEIRSGAGMKPTLLMVHCMVKEFVPYPPPFALEIADFEGTADLGVLMGDIHITDYRKTSDGLVIGYPGTPELKSSKEPTEKSFQLFTLEGPEWKIISQEKRAIPNRPVVTGQFKDEDEFRALLCLIKSIPSAEFNDKIPMAFLEQYGEVENAKERITALFPEGSQFYWNLKERYHGKQASTTKALMESMDDRKRLEYGEILRRIEPGGTEAFVLSQAVLDDLENAEEVLNDFVGKVFGDQLAA